ncbi:hypothetical protein [Natronincola ferrireducens]|uniref:Uncharacterized protein n=1 Tax=Natronincola ferrireducens TaxID=393762 RepID=A0A1G9H8Z0_9FIRM|nr:hypothetical protein [Natronincola ferrireducens]SDL09416.1 hypothetical protein SAMN05660472_02589 [Natronincola ferrireducens]
MDKKEKLQQLLRRKERADTLPAQTKIKWKDEIIKLEKKIKALKEELEEEGKLQQAKQMTEGESMVLDLLALNSTATLYLYESFVDINNSIIEEFMEEMLAAIYDYFETKDKEALNKAKTLNHVLLDTIYQNCKRKEVGEHKQLGFKETKEKSHWG